MLIDWFTVIAQILNFLVLVWLLKRFLYKPVLGAIDAREKRIADQLTDAANQKSEARKQLEDLDHKNELFDNQRDALLRQATEEAHERRQKLLEEARSEADTLRSRRQEMLRNEQRTLEKEIARRTQQEVLAIARKALADLAGATLEERMGELFIRRLHQLTPEEKLLLSNGSKPGSRPVLVRSALELPVSQRTAIESAIHEALGAGAPVQFETTPDLVGGIELSANGRKIAWNFAEYLKSLDQSLTVLLEGSTTDVQGGSHGS